MSDLAARLDRLDALEQIRALAHRYAHAFAAADFDELVGLFVEDVRVGRGVVGRDALAQQLRGAMRIGDVHRSLRITILHVGTHLVDLDGPGDAHGECYSHGEMQRGDGTWFHQAIRYRDVYARRDGRWSFVRRRHELFYGYEPPGRPNGLPPANWPEHDVGTGTLPTWARGA